MRLTLSGLQVRCQALRWQCGKIHSNTDSLTCERMTMSTPSTHTTNDHAAADDHPMDVVESVVHNMPVILPLAGAVLMFLLAFIAVMMA